MAIVRVQSPVVGNGSGTTIAKAFGSNVTAGNLMVACFTSDKLPTAIASTGAPTWAFLTPFLDSGATQYLSIGYCANAPSGATTVTATFTSAGAFNGIIIAEYSGAGASNAAAFDTNTPGRHNTTSTTPTDAAMTATDLDLVVSYIISTAGGITITAGASFAIVQQDATDIAAMEDRVLASSGSITCGFGFSPTAQSGIISACFKPAGGAAAVIPELTMAPMTGA